MKNKEIADLFNRMGTLLEIKGEIVFKVRAYFKAAENISSLAEDIAVLKEQNRLSEISGLGKTLQEKVAEYLETNKLSAYEKLIQDVPESLLEIVNIPSIGPKKAKLLFDELEIKTVAQLKKAAESGALLKLEGIRKKTVENILKGIQVVEQGQERMDLGTAFEVAEQFAAQLKKIKEVKRVEFSGSLRRGRETVRDIDILIDATNPAKVMDAFTHLPQVKQINAHGETKSSVLTTDNVQIDLRIVDSKQWGAALLYFTGSKNFNIKLRQIAMKKEMKINEYGVFKVKGDQEQCVASETEKECLQALDLPYIAPELREDIGEEELFSGKKLPKLIEQKDIQGEFHVHSNWSDGQNTIAQMVDAAMQRGYKYLAISDHSQRLKVAGGVSIEDLKKKRKEIDELNEKLSDFRILFGTEVEIDSEGNLDYNDKVLSEFDVVIGAIHSGFEQSRQQLTNRLVKACQNKYVHMIAHPTGVHLGKREAYDIDFKEVCKAALDHNVFLEINSFPIRLDLNSANVYFARSLGVKFVINTDAHHVDHLAYMNLGVGLARRGWLEAKDVLNTNSLKDVLKMIKK